MSMKRFEECLKFVAKWEGGYSDHPNDPGGATNGGITQGSYNAWRVANKLPIRPVKDMTRDEYFSIYEANYWRASKAKWISSPLDLVVFDTAVNFGVGGCHRLLNIALGIDSSTWKLRTSEAVHTLNASSATGTAITMVALRMEHRGRIVVDHPDRRVFLAGWLNRDRDLLNLLLE